MPGLSTFLKQALLNEAFGDTRYAPAVVSGTIAALYAQLHVGPPGPLCTVNPATDTTRQLVTVADAALVSGFYENVSTATTTWTNFQTPGLDTASGLTDFSLWDAATAGHPLGRGPLGGFAPNACSVLASNDTFTSAGSGYSNGNSVEVYREPGGTLPAGLTEDTRYYVVNQSGATFQLSSTDPASTTTLVDVTSDGALRVIRAVRYFVNFGATIRFPSGQFALRSA